MHKILHSDHMPFGYFLKAIVLTISQSLIKKKFIDDSTGIKFRHCVGIFRSYTIVPSIEMVIF